MQTKYRLLFFGASLALLAALLIFHTGGAQENAAPANQAVLVNLTINRISSGGGVVGGVISTSGFINCGPICTYYAESGTAVQLDATPFSNYKFTGWSGDVISQDSTIYFLLNQNMVVTANFVGNWKVFLPLIQR